MSAYCKAKITALEHELTETRLLLDEAKKALALVTRQVDVLTAKLKALTEAHDADTADDALAG